MNDTISDQELRQRLASFNAVVPPVTASTRKLLLKKLADLEGNRSKDNAETSKMPPPKQKPKTTNGTNESIMISSSGNRPSQYTTFDNTDSPKKSPRRRRQYRAADPFDTGSDSDIDNASLGRSVLATSPNLPSSSPKTHETSLMNVSNWNAVSGDEDQSIFSSPDTKKIPSKTSNLQNNKKILGIFDTGVNISPREPVIRRPRSGPVTETPHADQAIQRWKEKMMNQSYNKTDISNTSQFDMPSPISPIYTQNSRRYIQPIQQRPHSNSYTRNTQYIIFIVISFFVIIFGLYFTSIQSNSIVLPSGILNSLCAKKNLQGYDCNAEQEKIKTLYNNLISQVTNRYIKNKCENPDIDPTLDTQTVYEHIATHETIPAREIEELLELFKSIAKTNNDSPIGFDTKFKMNDTPNVPFFCAVKNIFANMFYFIVWLGIVGLSVLGVYFGICYFTTKSEKHKKEVNTLVEKIINLLKAQAQNHPNEPYLAIIHIRDQLIPPIERQEKSKIWAEVEQYFTESESRIRSEIQQINGEDFQIWRWIQPVSPGTAKQIWQGQAFETNEGSMNSPQPSPTSCLKIRHMFGPDSMTNIDCETRVKDAILEKCEGVELLHLSVDCSSQEGCVYVKCSSPTEAGKAYRQLHGFWYDGKLVTVKFLRLERYHQRFPDAINKTVPLRPSNNERRSLQ
ncbi:inner nuclear membrane protein Man1 [Daktulosphaira vitifoliae]|uniref:inner nuclear membrane protein Man1 n=1 Tax=Daktulosphaira vitifoliae TaxID=58002 RepID=UPI0021A9DBA1|nr:inner nuclear membrane protein Man1 [Daktulosphaira vitifoliae]XP_050543881.1 inner nuclear membrane protein Man1 [Daktulosphaira vitifoliae]